MLDAIRELRPLRRTHSLPPARPPTSAACRHFPPALEEIFRATSHRATAEELLHAVPSLRRSGTPHSHKISSSSVSPEPPAHSPAVTDTKSSQPSPREKVLAPFDRVKARESPLWALAWREHVDCTPPGVQRFVEEMRPLLRQSEPSPSPSPGFSGYPRGQSSRSTRARERRTTKTRDASASRGLSVSHHSVDSSSGPSSAPGGKDALASIQRWGQTHAASSIPVTLAHRERGLFGAAKQKELYQMVISILNKVTTDAGKFTEVKNALLRLPIPEASVESLSKVINVFLRKAILEPHFSHLYAKLMMHLCRGPSAGGNGVPPSGTSTPNSSAHPSRCPSPLPPASLEMRVGKGIVDLCIKEFQTLLERTGDAPRPSFGDDGDTLAEPSEEEIKKMRDRLCGTVRFAFELHQINFIDDVALRELFTCCAGRGDVEIVTPPVFQPSDAQMSALIEMIKYRASSKFYQSEVWINELQPRLLPWLQHWQQFYPIPRIRFLLLSSIEALTSTRAAARGSTSRPTTPAELSSHKPSEGETTPGNRTGGKPPAGAVLRYVPGMGSDGCSHPPSRRESLVPPPEYHDWMANLPNPQCIAQLMSLCSKGLVSLETFARDLVTRPCAAPHVMVVLQTWAVRGMTVVKESFAREQFGELLRLTLQEAPPNGPIPLNAAHLRESLQHFLHAKFNDESYECVMDFFEFFAVLVLSDAAQVVMNLDWLSRGMEWVLTMRVEEGVPPLGLYLEQVTNVYSKRFDAVGFPSSRHGHHSTGEPSHDELRPSDPLMLEEPLARFRPLLTLMSAAPGRPLDAWLALPEEQRAAITSQCVELHVFELLRGGAAPGRMERLFECVRCAPHLSTDTTLAAEMLTGVLVAEHFSPGMDFLSDAMAVLQIAVDQSCRRESEIRLVQELLLLARQFELVRVALQNRVMRVLKEGQVISTEVFLLWQEYFHRYIIYAGPPSNTYHRNTNPTPAMRSSHNNRGFAGPYPTGPQHLVSECPVSGAGAPSRTPSPYFPSSPHLGPSPPPPVPGFLTPGEQAPTHSASGGVHSHDGLPRTPPPPHHLPPPQTYNPTHGSDRHPYSASSSHNNNGSYNLILDYPPQNQGGPSAPQHNLLYPSAMPPQAMNNAFNGSNKSGSQMHGPQGPPYFHGSSHQNSNHNNSNSSTNTNYFSGGAYNNNNGRDHLFSQVDPPPATAGNAASNAFYGGRPISSQSLPPPPPPQHHSYGFGPQNTVGSSPHHQTIGAGTGNNGGAWGAATSYSANRRTPPPRIGVPRHNSNSNSSNNNNSNTSGNTYHYPAYNSNNSNNSGHQ